MHTRSPYLAAIIRAVTPIIGRLLLVRSVGQFHCRLRLFVSPVVSGIVTIATHANATKGPISIGLQHLLHAELGWWRGMKSLL
jgi:hypothetical protein